MNLNQPLVSICLPAYNNELYIAETIESVLAQTYTNWQLFVVDDRSTDNTVQVIRQFTDPRINVMVNERNLGMHGNWSKALSQAQGDYVKLLCGDDLLMPECLKLQVHLLTRQENADVELVACKRKIIDSTGKEKFGSFYKLPPGKYSGSFAVKSCVTFGTNLIGEPMSVMFRANTFKKNNISLGSNNYMIDLDMYTKLLAHGKLIMMKETLAAFRIYSQSMTGSLGRKMHSRYFSDFASQAWLKSTFGVGIMHRSIGRLMESAISAARALILSTSRS